MKQTNDGGLAADLQKLNNSKDCEALIDAYRMRDYYGNMCELAQKKIDMLTIKMSWSDIRYCIERTSK